MIRGMIIYNNSLSALTIDELAGNIMQGWYMILFALYIGQRLCVNFYVSRANFLATLCSHLDVTCSCYLWSSLFNRNANYSYKCLVNKYVVKIYIYIYIERERERERERDYSLKCTTYETYKMYHSSLFVYKRNK